MIIAQVDGQAEQAREAVRHLEGVVGVDATGSDVIIQASNGRGSYKQRGAGPQRASSRRQGDNPENTDAG